MRMTWKWIWSVWESSKRKQNHVCFLSAFCKICELSDGFLTCKGILTKWTPSVPNWRQIRGGEAESEAEKEERNVKTRATDWRTRDIRQRCFTLRCECWVWTMMTMLHAEFFTWWFNFLTEFRGSNSKKQVSKHEGAPADTGEHMTFSLLLHKPFMSQRAQ